MKQLKMVSIIALTMLFLACGNDDTPGNDGLSEEAFLIIDNPKALRNQEISFSLVSQDLEGHTDVATFYVNDQIVVGNAFSSETEASFEVYASYVRNGSMVNTDTQTIEVFIPKRKILLEGFTGVWCGFCPRKTTAVEDLRSLTDDAAVVSIHGNSINTGTDPLTIDDGMFLKNHFEIAGYPTGLINRNELWNFADDSAANEPFFELVSVETTTSISVEPIVLDNQLDVRVVVVAETDLTDHKTVVYLLEDDILLDQVSYFDTDPESPFYQKGNPIIDFAHKDVLREILTDPLGDDLFSIGALRPIADSFIATLSPEYNMDKLKIVVALLNENGEVVNAQYTNLNEIKTFE